MADTAPVILTYAEVETLAAATYAAWTDRASAEPGGDARSPAPTWEAAPGYAQRMMRQRVEDLKPAIEQLLASRLAGLGQ